MLVKERAIGRTLRGYRTEILPNNKQRTLLKKNIGAARFVYNWGLEKKLAALESGAKLPTGAQLSRDLTKIKKSEAPWLKEVSRCAPQMALWYLEIAFDRFFRKLSRLPKFKSKKDGETFKMFATVRVTEKQIKLPKIGRIKLKETGYIPTNSRVVHATVTEKAGRWFVGVLVEELAPNQKPEKDEHAVVGVDLGIKTFATVSDGSSYLSPRPLKRNLRKLKKFNQAVSRKKKGSNNRKKASARLSRLHTRIGNIRKDFLHKLTTKLARTKRVVVVEDLSVSWMLKNRSLSRAVSDLGLREFRRQLAYKGPWYGCEVITASRLFPSSKTCSNCGEINKELALKDREWRCPSCSVLHDRDFNAAKNLEHVAARSSETLNACGEKSSGSEETLNETGLNETGMEREMLQSL